MWVIKVKKFMIDFLNRVVLIIYSDIEIVKRLLESSQ